MGGWPGGLFRPLFSWNDAVTQRLQKLADLLRALQLEVHPACVVIKVEFPSEDNHKCNFQKLTNNYYLVPSANKGSCKPAAGCKGSNLEAVCEAILFPVPQFPCL